MRRSLALIAVGAAVAVAAVIVVAGVTSDGEAAGGEARNDVSATALPSGHPSISADEPEDVGDGAQVAETESTVERLEARRDEQPGDVRVLLDLGEAYFMAERLDEAEQAYSQALETEPGSTAARVGLAMVWHAQGKSGRAEEALRAVLEEHPDDQDAHYSLAIVLFSNGEIDAAKEEWQTAAAIDPKTVTGRRSQSFVDLLDDGESSSPHSSD